MLITGSNRMHTLTERLGEYLRAKWPDCTLEIEHLADLPGGISKQTYRFDALITRGGSESVLPLILRMDLPAAEGVFQNSRLVEYQLLSRLREKTRIPVPQCYFVETEPKIFGQPGMILERVRGATRPDALFHDAQSADRIARALCESIAALHTTTPSLLNADGILDDPRSLGIRVDSWEVYLDSMFEVFVRGYASMAFDALPVLFDVILHLRRNRPRALPLSIVHGDVHPWNIVFEGDQLSAIIDWENAHLGDPREDLGWFYFFDEMMGTGVTEWVRQPGGFLAYYNQLTGYAVTAQEVRYFQMFAFVNLYVQGMAALKRRFVGEHEEIMTLSVLRGVLQGNLLFSQLLGESARLS